MRTLLTIVFLLQWTLCFGQWTTTNIPFGPRYDDVFFINDSIGWAAGGGIGIIYKTEDGGQNWTSQFQGQKYLRSIEFLTPSLGFCGSLDSSLYKTTDGGVTWTDIAEIIVPKPKGICGLSAPDANTIYGCGIWSSPAYVIKSTDGGNTWESIDLSQYAKNLVDIHFINADTGFVSGTANPIDSGGIILQTTDGGKNWKVKQKTMRTNEYIWKIQSPDGKHYFASIQADPTAKNVRVLKSNDRGESWQTIIVSNTYSYVQTVGFLDSLHGWTGGEETLYETKDGGINWQKIQLGSSYNRFFKVNDSTAFLTGQRIYKYNKTISTNSIDQAPAIKTHILSVSPNPVHEEATIDLLLQRHTFGILDLIDENGQVLKEIFYGRMEEGKHQFTVDFRNIPSKWMYVIFHSNEGMIYHKVLKHSY